jgi:cyclophilin family peptidyl-prolyl cis-trans isomerase
MELTKENFKRHISLSKNKYCFFDISINGQLEEKVIFELFYDKCPLTCNNFISLCRGVKISNAQETLSYENTTIHRIVKNGYIQGGDLKHMKTS